MNNKHIRIYLIGDTRSLVPQAKFNFPRFVCDVIGKIFIETRFKEIHGLVTKGSIIEAVTLFVISSQ